MLRDADPGEARDDLLAALRKGAQVRLWIRGPASVLAEHYAGLDSLTEGVAPVNDALNTTTAIGLARVDDSPPLIACGPAPS